VGTLFQATRDFAARPIDRTIPPVLITPSTAIAVTLFAGVWSVFHEKSPTRRVMVTEICPRKSISLLDLKQPRLSAQALLE
jgi:hypothetical protein